MNKDIYRTLLALLALVFTACVNEVDAPPSEGGGRLQLSLANISTATTRTTPRDIGAPLASDLHLTITNVIGRAVYDDVFTEDVITLPTGRYDVVVSYGRNALMAIDAPYYIGTDNVEIKKDETTEASITASVGNALVSVKFGNDAEETARFERFYSDYAIQVFVDNYYMSISKDEPGKSIYVQAGSHVTLRFWGKLKMEDDREVSTVLESKDLPDVLNAADHAIVTLSLPNPESALGVDISKVEVETVTLEETIPLSWLPVPQATSKHQYDDKGNLVGTNLMFSNSYPGMTWKAEVMKAGSTEILRTVEGTGDLTSAYTDSNDWPYLPTGNYTAKFYLQMNEAFSQTSSRTFSITEKPNLSLSVGGYSSYTKYLEGDIDAANACERLTVYNLSVGMNIDEKILSNSHYSYSFTYNYDGAISNVPAGKNSYILNKIENNAVRANPYVLKGQVTFDGITAKNQKEFRITGLPYIFSITSHSEWSEDGKVEWNVDDNYVQLGGWTVFDQTITTNSSIYIPQGTKYFADYNVNIHHSWAGTTFSITVSGQEILSITEGSVLIHVDVPHSGTTDVFTANDALTSITCRNSYGDDYNYSQIYALRFKYGQ